MKKILLVLSLVLLSSCCNCVIRSPQVLGGWQVLGSGVSSFKDFKVTGEDLFWGSERRGFNVEEEIDGILLLKLDRAIMGAEFVRLTPVVNKLNNQTALSVDLLNSTATGFVSREKVLLHKK